MPVTDFLVKNLPEPSRFLAFFGKQFLLIAQKK
jgi:hypothetical protein